MYFGVLSVGADITGGFLAMKYIRASKSKISLIFKDFHADFLKRAEGDVHFLCSEGAMGLELNDHFRVSESFAQFSKSFSSVIITFLKNRESDTFVMLDVMTTSTML